jgi:hypothetical protein
MKIKTDPALFETRFTMTQQRPMSDEETIRAVLGAFRMVLLERIRGWLSIEYLEKYSKKKLFDSYPAQIPTHLNRLTPNLRQPLISYVML